MIKLERYSDIDNEVIENRDPNDNDTFLCKLMLDCTYETIEEARKEKEECIAECKENGHEVDISIYKVVITIEKVEN